MNLLTMFITCFLVIWSLFEYSCNCSERSKWGWALSAVGWLVVLIQQLTV